MRDDEAIAGLAGDIYDAALDPSLRQAALEKIAAFVGGVAGWVIRRDRLQGTGEALYDFGCQPRYHRLYFETYIRFDPVSPAILSSNPGEVISNSSIMPRRDFVKTRFYEEWMAPQGWLENIFVTLDSSPTQVAALAIARGKQAGWADDGVHQRVRRIVPHLRNASLIVKAVRLRTGQMTALADALDGISAGVFLVDAEGRIVHANASGSAMLAGGILPGVIIEGQTIPERSASRTVLAALAQAHRSGAPVASRSIALPVKSPDGERYVAHCLPLTSGRRREAVGTYRAVAAVFVQKAELGGAAVAEVIGRRYQLTPTELRVLLTIVDTGGVPDTAGVLGIAETTVKTHLRRLFAKTGASRQLELARLVAGFSGIASR
ncbi:MAG: LuxR C-terminal-related transcriptional regulator [Rhodomicrobiaceae bacterium]